jgi:signal transduction histidine kinase
MRHSHQLPLFRGLVLFSLLLLALVEYLWLRNEYRTRHGEMEDRLTHVMYSAMRDVEDSLIFNTLSDAKSMLALDSGSVINMQVKVAGKDTLHFSKDIVQVRGGDKFGRSRHPMRAFFLDKVKEGSATGDSAHANLSVLVLNRIRTVDTTGEAQGYRIVTWSEGDTAFDDAASRPAFDFLAGNRMALANTEYRADLLHDMLPLIAFAILLWGMIAAAFYYILASLRRQIALNALRDEFVSNITHELKTPITTVGVALESMSRSGEIQGPSAKAYLDISRSELRRLSLLVERILHNNAPELHYERVDVRQLADDVLHHMQVQFHNRHAHVSLKTEGEDFVIRGDRTHMSGVLYNLLENALKYSPDAPEIEVRLARRNGTVHVDVTDRGVGIESAYHDKIFEKLYRVPSHDRHNVKGHGLGLSYVADVVRKHDGQVRVTSAPGAGSTFSLTFPAWHEN